MTGNSLMAGKASFNEKFICLNEYCPGLSAVDFSCRERNPASIDVSCSFLPPFFSDDSLVNETSIISMDSLYNVFVISQHSVADF